MRRRLAEVGQTPGNTLFFSQSVNELLELLVSHLFCPGFNTDDTSTKLHIITDLLVSLQVYSNSEAEA